MQGVPGTNENVSTPYRQCRAPKTFHLLPVHRSRSQCSNLEGWLSQLYAALGGSQEAAAAVDVEGWPRLAQEQNGGNEVPAAEAVEFVASPANVMPTRR